MICNYGFLKVVSKLINNNNIISLAYYYIHTSNIFFPNSLKICACNRSSGGGYYVHTNGKCFQYNSYSTIYKSIEKLKL